MDTNEVVPQDDKVPLMKTRERRSNAGNRMKELLEQELEGMRNYRRIVSSSLDDGDDDFDELDLLFQEDEEDRDFEFDGGNYNSNNNNGPTGGRLKNADKLAEDDGVNINNDDMMLSSDSDEGSTENSDAEDEEAFIRRQERILRRKERSKRTAPKIIKRTKAETTVEKKKRGRTKHSTASQLDPESLLLTERRTSTRKSVIENRNKIYEKLAKAKAKRQLIREKLRKTRENAVEQVLTQEDRLKIAHETEIQNLQSLNKFKEQENFKKQSRLTLQQRQKPKFKPNELIETFLSTSWEVTPAAEINDREYWDAEVEKRNRKRLKKKYGKRSSKKSNENEISPQEIDQRGLKADVESGTSSSNLGANSDPNWELSVEKTENSLSGKHENNPEGGIMSQESSSQNNFEDKSTIHLGTETINESVRNQEGERQTDIHTGSGLALSHKNNEQGGKFDMENTGSSPLNLIHSSEKRVTFDDEPRILEIGDDVDNRFKNDANPSACVASSTDTPIAPGTYPENASLSSSIDDDVVKVIYEGPNQLVAKNFLTRYHFMNEAFVTTSPPDESELEYFGEKTSTTPDKQGTYEPFLRSKMTLTPDSIVDDEVKENTIPDLEFLSNFRAFGEYEKKEKIGVIQADKIDNSGLKITTPAPVGLYTANNNVRKRCLINNKPCQYFDPNLGIPYADLDGYNIIKGLLGGSSQSNYRWCGFRNGGIFLNISERPAKGVPKGF